MKMAPRSLLAIPVIGIVLAVACVILFIVLDYFAGRAVHTRPDVLITGTSPEAELVTAGQPVVIFGQAQDPEGVARLELWVNGGKLGDQQNPDQGSPNPWATNDAWIPTQSGDYVIILRAIDGESMTGESEPLLIHAGEKTADPNAATQYILQEGETIEEVAAQYGLNPDDVRARNPGGGSSLDLPPIPGGEPGAGDEPGGDGLPRVDPPAPAPPGGDEEPVAPAGRPWWSFMPLPDNFYCLILPDLCSPAGEGVSLPAAADEVGAVSTGPCSATVTWRDNSDNELGFQIYRLALRPRVSVNLVELVEAMPGSGTRLSYTDMSVPAGDHVYAVVAYNTAGNVWSASSERLHSDCPAIAPVDADMVTLSVEALSFSLEGGYDRLYCYVSLANAPFERVPGSPSDFIQYEGGTWDIASHMSGRNMRTVQIPAALPLHLDVSCLGWQGDSLVELGRFRRDHASDEWDGRTLSAGPDDGGFTVEYRINRAPAGSGGGGGGGSILLPIIDPSIPAPFNVRAGYFEVITDEPVPGNPDLGVRTIADQPGIAWDYEVDPANPRPPQFFNVYRQTPYSEQSLAYSTPDGMTHVAPQDTDCDRDVSYTVTAVVGRDPVTGDPIESPMSEVYTVPQSCLFVHITLESFLPHRSSSSYGWFRVNGRTLRWNFHADGGAILGSHGPSVTVTTPEVRVLGQDMYLFNRPGYGYQQNQATIEYPIHAGEPLNFSMAIYNHREIIGDDLWCQTPGGRGQRILEGMTLEEWVAFGSRTLEFDYGPCGVTLYILIS